MVSWRLASGGAERISRRTKHISPEVGWRSPPKDLSLGKHEVHVWQAALEQGPSQLDSYLATLSADERSRADRFHFDRDRQHFIAARGILRSILGLYLNRAPRSLSFTYSSHGKPALQLPSDVQSIRFNLSHSQGMALYAVARDREVGVDLEVMRDGPQTEEIAERFFSSREISTLRALPPSLQTSAFFLCWTRKEAYIKARGEGLSLPLDQFDVSLTPGEPAELLGTRPDPLEADRWSLKDLTPETPGYGSALAVEGRGWSLALWKCPNS